jgi:hypothetical protein
MEEQLDISLDQPPEEQLDIFLDQFYGKYSPDNIPQGERRISLKQKLRKNFDGMVGQMYGKYAPNNTPDAARLTSLKKKYLDDINPRVAAAFAPHQALKTAKVEIDNLRNKEEQAIAEFAETRRAELEQIATPENIDSLTQQFQKEIEDTAGQSDAKLQNFAQEALKPYQEAANAPIPEPPDTRSGLEKTGDFFAAIPKSLITSAYNGIVNRLRQDFKTEALRLSGQTLSSYISGRAGDETIQGGGGLDVEEASSLRYKYRQWLPKQDKEVQDLPNEERVQIFLTDTTTPEELDKLNKVYKEKQSTYRAELEKSIQGIKKESAEVTEGIPQSISEVKNMKDALDYLGFMGGQGLSSLVSTAVTGGQYSIAAQRSSVKDTQLDQLAAIVSKETGLTIEEARENIIKTAEDDPDAGRMIADMTAMLDIASVPTAITGKGLGLFIEGLTEVIQSEGEEYGATLGSGAEYKYSPIRSVDSFIGGLVGAKTAQTATSAFTKAKEGIPVPPEVAAEQDAMINEALEDPKVPAISPEIAPILEEIEQEESTEEVLVDSKQETVNQPPAKRQPPPKFEVPILPAGKLNLTLSERVTDGDIELTREVKVKKKVGELRKESKKLERLMDCVYG